MRQQFRLTLNDLRSLVLAFGLKSQLVISLGVPGSAASCNQQPFIGPGLGNNVCFIAFCIWRLLHVTRMTLLCCAFCMSTEIVPARQRWLDSMSAWYTQFPGSHQIQHVWSIGYGNHNVFLSVLIAPSPFSLLKGEMHAQTFPLIQALKLHCFFFPEWK